MLGVFTRVMVVGLLAVMLAAWAINAVHDEGEPDQPITRMYS
jgi:uncharacterized membrane protein YphA (DoxX/SURF4 family)